MKACLIIGAVALLLLAAFLPSVLLPVTSYALQIANQGVPSCVGTPTPTVATTSGPAATTTPSVSSPPAASATAAGNGGGALCINPNGNLIVQWALAISAHLYGNPDVWYDRQIPPQALAWWEATCPGCRQWQNGNLQCVMFNAAVFGVAGLPLYFGPNGNANAIDFWGNYANRRNWVEIPSAWAAPGQRGMPEPGDMMVWYEDFAPLEGHIAVVVAVTPPTADTSGSLVFAEANGPGPLVQETISPDLTVNTWAGGQVIGFIRYVGPPVVTGSTG